MNDQKKLPQKLETLLSVAFTTQFERDTLTKEYKESTKEIGQYFESNDDGFEVVYGEGGQFNSEFGTVEAKFDKVRKTDKEKIIQLVESGKITLEQIINISAITASKLATLISEDDYVDCVKTSDKKVATITLKRYKGGE